MSNEVSDILDLKARIKIARSRIKPNIQYISEPIDIADTIITLKPFFSTMIASSRDSYIYTSSFQLEFSKKDTLFVMIPETFDSIAKTPFIRNAFILSFLGHVLLNKLPHKTSLWDKRVIEWRKKRVQRLT